MVKYIYDMVWYQANAHAATCQHLIVWPKIYGKYGVANMVNGMAEMAWQKTHLNLAFSIGFLNTQIATVPDSETDWFRY